MYLIKIVTKNGLNRSFNYNSLPVAQTVLNSMLASETILGGYIKNIKTGYSC